MAIGTITIGQTPCCGVIERSYECWPDRTSPTGMTHQWEQPTVTQGIKLVSGSYAPTFDNIAAKINRGICPDCGQRFQD